jgi:Flp pilus assembly protein TadB
MQLVSIKTIIAMLWVSAVSVAGLAGHLNSLSSWTLLAAVAVLPPLVMMRRWHEPRQSMSQSIQEALR